MKATHDDNGGDDDGDGDDEVEFKHLFGFDHNN